MFVLDSWISYNKDFPSRSRPDRLRWTPRCKRHRCKGNGILRRKYWTANCEQPYLRCINSPCTLTHCDVKCTACFKFSGWWADQPRCVRWKVRKASLHHYLPSRHLWIRLVRCPSWLASFEVILQLRCALHQNLMDFIAGLELMLLSTRNGAGAVGSLECLHFNTCLCLFCVRHSYSLYMFLRVNASFIKGVPQQDIIQHTRRAPNGQT